MILPFHLILYYNKVFEVELRFYYIYKNICFILRLDYKTSFANWIKIELNYLMIFFIF
jgi:hypothetical protein